VCLCVCVCVCLCVSLSLCVSVFLPTLNKLRDMGYEDFNVDTDAYIACLISSDISECACPVVSSSVTFDVTYSKQLEQLRGGQWEHVLLISHNHWSWTVRYPHQPPSMLLQWSAQPQQLLRRKEHHMILEQFMMAATSLHLTVCLIHCVLCICWSVYRIGIAAAVCFIRVFW